MDLYVGGAEHVTRHLIYARFWHKFLYDIGMVNYNEPFKKLKSVGLILGADGQKMSKRWGNVVNPDDIVKKYGADTLRLYEMFMGPFEDYVSWDTKGIEGCYRFLHKIWRLGKSALENKSNKENEELKPLIHKTIKKVSEDIKNFKFNTAISAMMILANEMLNRENEITKSDIKNLLIILSVFAPHISEEVWNELKHKGSIQEQKWPAYDQKLITEEKINLIIQINGKVRDIIEVPADISEEKAKKVALSSEKVKKWIDDSAIIAKIIFVANKLINFVTIDK